MAQATGAMSASAAYAGVSANGSTWIDASGYSSTVIPSGGERATGVAYTFDGDVPILKAGKRGPITVTLRAVYTESTAQPYALAKTAYEAGSAFYIRWSPGGGDAGEIGYTTSVGIVKNPPYVSVQADSADPIIFEVQLECASVTQATIGTAGW